MHEQMLNSVLQSLLEQIAMGYGNLLPVTYYFFYAFATITLVKLGLAYAFQDGNILAALLAKLFKIGLMLWLITNLPYLHEVLRDGAIKLGIRAAGGNTMDLVLNPSQIADYGLKVAAPIRVWMYDLSWSVNSIGSNVVNILFGVIAVILIVVAFCYLAYQMFMALVDFYFTSVLAPVFLAFQLFEPTAWMAVGAIRGPIQHAVKLFTMAFIINLAEPWIASLIIISKLQDFTEIASLVVAALILVALSLKAGSWSAGMFSGSPTASGYDLVTAAAGVVSAGACVTMAGSSSIKGAQKVAGSVASGAIATGAAAVTGAALRGVNHTGASKLASMAYGAAEGAAGVLMATPKAIKHISQGFKDSITSGIRQGYISSGGDDNVPDPTSCESNESHRMDVIKKAKIYQRIAGAFKEQQSFNNRPGDVDV